MQLARTPVVSTRVSLVCRGKEESNPTVTFKRLGSGILPSGSDGATASSCTRRLLCGPSKNEMRVDETVIRHNMSSIVATRVNPVDIPVRN